LVGESRALEPGHHDLTQSLALEFLHLLDQLVRRARQESIEAPQSARRGAGDAVA
jgi:hypothetical protein